LPVPVSPLLGFLFGAPLAALGAAAGAVAIPIIIHLLNRRRFRIVTWAAMRFLLNAERKNSRRMRLEQIILLAVRCLLVGLLVLAMASVMPWAETVWANIFPSSFATAGPNSLRTHKILVIDGSFSMAMRPEDESYFERARALANQIVEESPRGDGFSVVLMAAPARRIVSEASEDASKVGAEIQNLKLPHGNADVGSALTVIEDLLRHSPDKFVEKEVYFLTDLQRSTWIDRRVAGSGESLEKFQAARKIFIDVGRDGLSNTAVTNLSLGAGLPTTKGKTPITATIQHYGPEKRGKVHVQLWIGKARETAGDKPLELSLAAEEERELGQVTTVSFQYQFTAPGDYVVQVKVDGDKLDLDDVRSAVVRVKNKVPVLLVNGKEATDPLDTATEYLKTYLDPSEDGQGPMSLFSQPKVIPYSEFGDAVSGNLADYDCVFLCDVPRFSLSEVRRLETHLRAGGGVVITLGRNVDPGAYNDFLYHGGKGILPAKLTSKQQSPRDCFFYFAPDNKVKLDPPLDAFTSDRSRLKLLEPEFYTYYRSEPDSQARKILTFMPYSFLARTSPATDEEVKKLPRGDPAMLEWQPPIALAPAEDGQRLPGRCRGRVILITSTVNEDWNNWCKKDDCFLTLVDDLTRFAVAGRLREHAVLVGDPLEEYLQSAVKRPDADIRMPDNRRETVRAQSFEDSSVVRWADTDLSGLYVATIGQSPQELAFAVNVPTATETSETSESDPARAVPEDLRRAYPDWDFQLVTDPHEVNHSTGVSGAVPEPARLPIGPVIARAALLAMFVLFLVQVVLAWWFGHYSGVPEAGRNPARSIPRGLAAGLLQMLPYGLSAGLFAVCAGIAFVLLHYAWSGDFLGFLPEGLRLFAESLLGIPAPAAGEGSHWRLEFFPYLWDMSADPWLVAALAAGSCVLIGVVYYVERTVAKVHALPSLVLGGLCACFALLALTVLLPQIRLNFERQAWPDVVILVDDSQSMSTADGYQNRRVQEVADTLAERLPKDGSELSQANRLGLARALVARGDSDWLTTLLSKRKFKLHIYHCSTKAARIADVTEADHLKDAQAALDGLSADPSHDSSRLGAAVRQVLNDFRGSSLAAIVMLSDGVTTEGEDLVKVSKYAGQSGVPLYLVGLGDNQKPRDLILHGLQVEETVYVNDRVVFEVRLTGNGYPDLTVPIQLREKGKKEVLVEQKVTVENGRDVKVKLVYQPTEKGEKTFVIDVPVQPGEASEENNKVERTIFVQESKLIKVLYVEGYPRYEFRFIKNLLERESALAKGNKSIDLKVFLLSAEPDWASQDKSAFEEKPGGVRISRQAFLDKDELSSFDVVIWGDVDPKAYPQMKDHLKNVADFVKDKGGGFLMIAGTQFAPHAYKDTPLKDILPIDVVRDAPAEAANGIAKGYRPELTSTGRQHPIFRFSSEEQENDEIWSRLKEMRWHSEGYKAKRAAEVLALYPGAKNRPDARDGVNEDRPRRDDEDRALVVQQFMGAGRCLFFGFDETWLWQFREDLLHFNQFWIQTVRYLARSHQGRIEIRLDRQTPYRCGEPIKVSVRFPDDAPAPGPEIGVKVTVERHPPKGSAQTETEVQTLTLAKPEGSRATYEGLLTNTPEGEYHFWLREPVVTGEKPRAECRVLAPPTEMENVQMNQPDMELAAQQSHGRFYTLADADRLPAELPSGTRVTINAPGPPLLVWNHVLVFLLAILLITTEWILRKRVNLL
jgi:hypothetical protein